MRLRVETSEIINITEECHWEANIRPTAQETTAFLRTRTFRVISQKLCRHTREAELDVRLVSLCHVFSSLLTRRAQVRRQASLSLSCVLPSLPTREAELDVRLVSLCHVFSSLLTRRAQVRRQASLSLSCLLPSLPTRETELDVRLVCLCHACYPPFLLERLS